MPQFKPRIGLLVKADSFDRAEHFIQQRDLGICAGSVTKTDTGHRTYWMWVIDTPANRRAVMAWFCEPDPILDTAPFPQGTLLWYTYPDRDAGGIPEGMPAS